MTYKTADSVQEEIDAKITESETVLVTYEITSEDLKTLEQNKTYNKGKVNPFSTYEDKPEETEEGNNSNEGSINTNVTKGNSSSGNTFYKNTGTK